MLLGTETGKRTRSRGEHRGGHNACSASQRQQHRRLLICGFLLLFVACCLVVFSGSAGALTPRALTPDPGPRAMRTLDADWLEVRLMINAKCMACHRPNSDRADLSTHQAMLGEKDGMPLIVPGKPEESLIWQYCSWNARAELDSRLSDTPMMPPSAEEWLTAGQQELLYRWIARGAPQFGHSPRSARADGLTALDFPSARECKICHPGQFEQWSRSMHAYAMHSPVMEAFNLSLIERTGGTVGTFCTRCHTPLGTALGENGSMRTAHRSRLSMEGVSCVVCHRVQQPYFKANTRHAIAIGGVFESCMYGPFDDAVSAQNGAHESSGQPFIKRSEFCGSCHDVTSPAGVRLEEAFSEWRNSPAAAEGITCQKCHMGPVAGKPVPEDHRPLGRAAVVPGVDPELIPLRRLSDHTFAGPDYSLLPDTEFPHKLDWMYEVDYRDFENLTPYQQKTLTDLRRRNRKQLATADAKRYELLRNGVKLDVRAPREIACGDALPVEARVQSTFAGHNYPTGFSAERQLWVQVVLIDPAGRVVYASGDFDRNGDLRDDHSRDVLTGHISHDKELFNFQSKFIALTNRGTERSVVLSVNRHLMPVSLFRPATEASAAFGRPSGFRLQKASLPPLGKAERTYRIPALQTPGVYRLETRLMFRHLPPKLLDEIGVPRLKPQLEAVIIDECVSEVLVRPR